MNNLGPTRCRIQRGFCEIFFFSTILAFTAHAAFSQVAGVDIYPGADIPGVVSASPAGTTFIIHPGMYRLRQSIKPKNGDSFIGQTTCDPIATPGSCTAIISGSTEIGSLATFDGMNYVVTRQTQHGAQPYGQYCYTGYAGCFYPEDLFFDGVQLTHLYSTTLPPILGGQWWFDYTNQTIYFHDNPAGHVVETSVAPAAFTANTANNVTFQYLTIEEFAAPIQTGMIDPHLNGSSTANINWVVRNSEIRRSHANGVRPNYGMQVYNNYLHHNGQLGVGGGPPAPDGTATPSGFVIQGNLISDNNTSMVSDQFGAGGIKVGNTRGMVIRGNTIQNNHGNAIHLDDVSGDVLIDGNLITGNLSGGIYNEIGIGTNSVIRNNIIQRNPREPIIGTTGYQIASFDGTGIDSYCNVVESDGAAGQQQTVAIMASNRTWPILGVTTQKISSGNTFHHNTVILDNTGNSGMLWWRDNDVAHQPNFWTLNPIPDYNEYHMPSLAGLRFIYDNDLSRSNTGLNWAQFVAKGVEAHGTADTNTTSGYPTVRITSPVDQSSISFPTTVTATASDSSGIDRVELYVDWTLSATVNGSGPYNFTLNSGTAGSHIVAAMAHSNAGIRNCNAVTITVQPPTVQPPTVQPPTVQPPTVQPPTVQPPTGLKATVQ